MRCAFLLPMVAGTFAAAAGDAAPQDVRLGAPGRGELLYRSAGAPFKPYVKELCTPSGRNVLVDSPEDHVHHHGLMFAIGVGEVDFWGEEPPDQAGTIRAEGPGGSAAGAAAKGGWSLAEDLAWRAPDGTVLLHETRAIRVHQDPGVAPALVFWRSVLSPPAEEAAALWGRHYFGLGMRLLREMDDTATFLHSEGAAGPVYRGDERLTPGRWCAALGTSGGAPVTVALFDHPLNPRHPAAFFTMSAPFAYLSATLNLEQQPRLLAPGTALDLRFGVALFDGHATPEEIEAAYSRFTALEDPLRGRENVALAARGTTALASSEFGPDYSAGKAIDGRWRTRETDKWNSRANVTPHFLRLDLGEKRLIDAIVVRHEGALPVAGGFVFNTANFRLQRSDRPFGPWLDLAPPLRRNSDNVTAHHFQPVAARYVRLLIETGEQNGGNDYGRIAEIEIYAPAAPPK
ncbi:MAG: PmoA family protein [Planctomycetes bacterium]|nr:PmoA family protein [Planctomycetota bacterium]